MHSPVVEVVVVDSVVVDVMVVDVDVIVVPVGIGFRVKLMSQSWHFSPAYPCLQLHFPLALLQTLFSRPISSQPQSKR